MEQHKMSSILASYGEPITYFGIAYTLTEEDNHRLALVDASIKERMGDSIFPTPNGARHITIMNLTSVVDGYMDSETAQFFKDSTAQYRTRIRDAVSGLRPFIVTLNSLTVGQQAIILQGQDEGQIQKIRDALQGIPRRGGHVIDSGFIHSTQARYRMSVAIDDVREKLSSIQVNIPISIDKIGLVCADISLSKPHVVLEEFALKSS